MPTRGDKQHVAESLKPTKWKSSLDLSQVEIYDKDALNAKFRKGIKKLQAENKKLKERIRDLEEQLAKKTSQLEDQLYKMSHLPGTYNGHICAICSHDEAKWECVCCDRYFCLDHIPDSGRCEDCGDEDESDEPDQS